SSQNQHRQFWFFRADLTHHVETGFGWQHQIQNDEVVVEERSVMYGVCAIVYRIGRIALLLQALLDKARDFLFVLYDQNAHLYASCRAPAFLAGAYIDEISLDRI